MEAKRETIARLTSTIVAHASQAAVGFEEQAVIVFAPHRDHHDTVGKDFYQLVSEWTGLWPEQSLKEPEVTVF